MIRNAKDLSPDQKMAIESLLGRAISDQEEISVRALQPPRDVTPERRREILAGLDAYFERIDARRGNASADDADDAIKEALRSTRPNYRPIR